MIKYVLSFLAGCVTVIAVLAAIAVVPFRRMVTATAARGPTTATVTIHVSQDPNQLRLGKDPSAVLDQISNLTDAEKKRIRDGISSGLVTDIELQSDINGESRMLTIPAHPSGFIIRGSSSGHFGPAHLQFDDGTSPNKAPDRTAPSVTPPAAQEPRH